MFISFTRIAVVSFALASIVACSSGETSNVSEGLASTPETTTPEAKATCPRSAPLPVYGDACPHKGLFCPTNSFTCTVGTPYLTCSGKGANLTWGTEQCVAITP
jgi:hypothetical protein